jgi:hypothetical protein
MHRSSENGTNSKNFNSVVILYHTHLLANLEGGFQ